jgi:hypothetical protein
MISRTDSFYLPYHLTFSQARFPTLPWGLEERKGPVSFFEEGEDKPQRGEFVEVCRARTALLTPSRLCSTMT